jgi:hypothetical protein
MRKIICGFICSLVFLSINNKLFSQVTLSGPDCVTNNTIYLYTVNGNFDSSHTWTICVTGGSIDGIDSSCSAGKWDPFVKISWNSDSSGSLQLTSDSGNVSLHVDITTQLTGGVIDSTVVVQVVDSVTTPNPILCSTANGGGCSPSYIYQWQQSVDNLTWTDISGATNQNLEFSTALQQSAYYRRKAKTPTSDAIAYSSVAAIFINR